MSRSRRLLPFAGLLLALSAGPAVAQDAASLTGAGILMYHRFGENTVPSTNIRLEQFDAHIAELKSGPYHVMGLPEIVAKLKSGEKLPDRAVAVTADDAYISAFTEGWPRLKKAGIPFTLFVATEPVTSKLRGYLTWDQIRQMKAEGVTIGAHSHRHPSLPALGIARSWAGYIDATPDLVPVLGDIPALRGLVLATGFSGHGFAMGPIAGRLVSELIVDGKPSLDIAPFRFSRFAEGAIGKPRNVL